MPIDYRYYNGPKPLPEAAWEEAKKGGRMLRDGYLDAIAQAQNPTTLAGVPLATAFNTTENFANSLYATPTEINEMLTGAENPTKPEHIPAAALYNMAEYLAANGKNAVSGLWDGGAENPKKPEDVTWATLRNMGENLTTKLPETVVGAEGKLADMVDTALDRIPEPRSPWDIPMSTAYYTTDSILDSAADGLIAIRNLFKDDGKEKPEGKSWLETWLASGGGSGLGAGDGGMGAGGSMADYPSFNFTPDTVDTSKVKAPTYEGVPYNVWDVLAAGFANADFSGEHPDFSKAVNAMNEITDRGNHSVADAKNATSQAVAELERWKVAQQQANNDLKMRAAVAKTNSDIARWQAMQPRAIGGNKAIWYDSNGNMHWQQVDKQGEARTLASNAVMSDLMNMSERRLKKMSPQELFRRGQTQSLLLPKEAQVPYANTYFTQGLPMIGEK